MTNSDQKIEIIKDAINRRKPISFEYNKAGEPIGERIGKPYAIYKFTSKIGETSIKLDLFQTGGVTKTQLHAWKICDLDFISAIKIEENALPFHIENNYNSSSERYKNCIAKI